MGYLRNHLATVVTGCFAIFLSGMYFYMPAPLHQLLMVATIVTWFLVVICWLAQKSADWSKKHGGHTEHSHSGHSHTHEEKKSSTRLTNISVEELNKFRETFTAELNELKDEVKLNVFDNSLEISAQHKEEEEEKKKNYLRKERSEISYYRTLPLPEKVVSDKTNAKLVDGVLNITIPKATPTPKPKSSSIQVQ